MTDVGLPCNVCGAVGLNVRLWLARGHNEWWLNSLSTGATLSSKSHAGNHDVRRPKCQIFAVAMTTIGGPRPRPQVRRDYPLSLSISISGGKETNKDSPSNGERTGNSPSLESGGSVVRIVAWRSVLSGGPGPSPLEWGTREGDSPVVLGPCRTTRRCRRVGLFGNAAPIGR